MNDFFVLAKFIADMIAQERPVRILEIGGGDQYGYLLKALQAQCGITDGVVDRIEANLDAAGSLKFYDFILIIDTLEHMEPENARELLDVLQYKITKQILIITPLDSGAGYRKYHPVVFMGLDFSFSLLPDAANATQVYSVFPKTLYGEMPLDHIPQQETIRKLHVAFALPFHGLTGGMKALLQQVRHLTRKGHHVSAYFRSDSAESAIPPWSDLTEDDYTQQTVVPASGRFLDYIKDADIIILGGLHQAAEFLPARVPAVLWEQGYEAIFGEFGKALHSSSPERRNFHNLYRLPIHLLAVSDVIATALKGMYNRDALVYPNGIDTEIYHPAEKHNDVPVVLLTGHPSLAFKGFRFAFNVLSQAYANGLRFQVKWAAQVNVLHGAINFPLEVIVRPAQHELAGLYRNADVFLSTSLYESYALPPLEAMASGTAVVATDCGGIRAYAKHNENCILCRQGDFSAAVNALTSLLNQPDERQRLARAGRETALAHAAEVVVEKLERYLTSIVQYDRRQ